MSALNPAAGTVPATNDFQTNDGERTYPFREDTASTGVYGYGHTAKWAFADAANHYFEIPGIGYTAFDVKHGHAAITTPPNGLDFGAPWHLSIVAAPASNTIPITWVVTR